jgi:hypothetical protein
MQSEAFTSLVRPMQIARTVVWIALNGAILLYVVIACLRFGAPSTTAGAFSHPMALPLVAVAVAAVIAGRVLPTVIFPPQRRRDLLARDPDVRSLARNPRTGALDEERLARLEALPPHEQRLIAAAGASFTPFIIQLALQESVALCGLVLALLSESAAPIIPFAAVALVLNFMVSPKLDSVLAMPQGSM